MRKVLLLIILVVYGFISRAQTDTAFWFAAPDISSNLNWDQPILLRITANQQPCNVSISQPAVGGMPTQTISLLPNSTQTVDLTPWLSSIECTPGNTIQNKGIKISSDNKISAYYEVNENGPNSEIYALKGRNALGNEFYISSQYFLNNNTGYSPIPYSSFNIVASEDNTQVTITPSANIVGHAANLSFTITLNKGQTYAAIASSQLSSQHLQGSHVISTKAIAITLSDDLLLGAPYGGCADLAGDQTVPVSITGNEYIALRSDLNPPYDKLYITATQDATTVTQDGSLVTTLNSGQSVQLSLSGNVTYVQTSHPAYAYQLSGYGCEVGSAVLPKIDCTGSSSISVTRSSDVNFIVTLLVKNGGQNNFLVNNLGGVITAAQFTVVPGTGGVWYYAKVSLPESQYPSGSVINVSNSTNVFQMGVLKEDALSNAFGYFSDFNSLKATSSTSNDSVCANSNILLFGETISSAAYSWTGPAGFISGQQNPVINNPAITNSGDYILTVNIPGCGISKDTVTITVKPKSFSTINQSICEGQSSGGHSTTGSYIDIFVGANDCDSVRTLNLSVKPKSYATINQTICQGSSYLGYTSTGNYVDVLVAANGCDSMRTLNLDVTSSPGSDITKNICRGQTYEGYSLSGSYIDTLVATNGCDSVRIIHLGVEDLPSLNLGLDKSICQGDTILLDPRVAGNYLWQDGSTQSTYIAETSGTYRVTINNSCGNISDSIKIDVNICDIIFPNAFTPNDDGVNDIFKALHVFAFQSYKLVIYNRLGGKIFETNDFIKGWDGKFNWKNADAGTYVWYCNFKKAGKNGNLKGSVILIR